MYYQKPYSHLQKAAERSAMSAVLLTNSAPDSATLLKLVQLLTTQQRIQATVEVFEKQVHDAQNEIEQVVASYAIERARIITEAFANSGLGICERLQHVVALDLILPVKITLHNGNVLEQYICSKCLEVLSHDDSRKHKPEIEVLGTHRIDSQDTIVADPQSGTLDRALERWATKQPDLPPKLKYYQLFGPTDSPDGPGWYLGNSKVVTNLTKE